MVVTQTLTNVPNAVVGAYNATNGANHTCCNGSCQFQAINNSWYFPGGSNTAAVGTGFALGFNILSALEQNGTNFNVDFTSAQSIDSRVDSNLWQ